MYKIDMTGKYISVPYSLNKMTVRLMYPTHVSCGVGGGFPSLMSWHAAHLTREEGCRGASWEESLTIGSIQVSDQYI